MLHSQNIIAALQMYYQRLEMLKKEVSKETISEEKGDLEAPYKLGIIQEEVDNIYDCLRILDQLLKRC